MKTWWCGVALAALAAAAPVAGEDSTRYWTSPDWDVDAYADHCMATTVSELKEDGLSVFGVYYAAEDKYLSVNFSSPVTSSLKEDDKVTAELLFASTKRNEVDDGWGSPEFTVTKMDGGSTLFVLKIKADAVQTMLDDVSANDYVALQKNETIFAGAQLDGSAQAMKQLKACAFGIAGLNPRDPFAQ